MEGSQHKAIFSILMNASFKKITAHPSVCYYFTIRPSALPGWTGGGADERTGNNFSATEKGKFHAVLQVSFTVVPRTGHGNFLSIEAF